MRNRLERRRLTLRAAALCIVLVLLCGCLLPAFAEGPERTDSVPDQTWDEEIEDEPAWDEEEDIRTDEPVLLPAEGGIPVVVDGLDDIGLPDETPTPDSGAVKADEHFERTYLFWLSESDEADGGLPYAEQTVGSGEELLMPEEPEVEGKSFRLPFFAGPVGAVNLHYSDAYTDMTYNDVLVRACAENGIAAFTGDGTNPDVMTMATQAIGAAGGCGVPTIKPWNIDTVKAKMDQAKASGCFAVAMDVDAAGLPFLKNMTPPAGSKSVAELKEIVALAGRPFIVKGVMTVKGALKAKEAGAAAIVVSNHGGRVLDQCPATAEVLPEIADALKGSGVKVLVDGGIRSGVDVFKALALGADGVLICRPFVTAVYGGGEEGVKCYIDKIAGELADTMQMCGAHSISEITREMVRI